MSLSYPGVLEQQPSDDGNEVRFSNTLKQVSPNIFVWGPIIFHKGWTSYVMWLFRDTVCYILPNQQVFRKNFSIIEKSSSRAGLTVASNYWVTECSHYNTWDRCQAKFLTSRLVRNHKVIFYIPNTLRKLMIRA